MPSCRMLPGCRWLVALRPDVQAAAAVGFAVLLASLLGIWTRPVGFLATIWPANAVMLGMLVRFPAAATPLGWMASAVGFMTADLLTGASFLRALILNAANLIGVAAAYHLVYARLDQSITRLRHPESMLYLLLAAALGGAAAGAVGGIANPLLFNGGVIEGWTFWFVTESMNYITILPIILTFPQRGLPLRFRSISELSRHHNVKPGLALLLSCLVAVLVGGQGAIAFPVPALMWCGLTYSLFFTSILTLLFGCWSLTATSFGLLPNLAFQSGEMAVISLRMGISLVAIGPIMLASVMAARNDLQSRLEYLASHDQLTSAMNRAAFRAAVSAFGPSTNPVSLLLVDLDHFKQVNDTFGHAAGDEVLIIFARRARACLRSQDLFGRIGGEEFAVLIPGCGADEAVAVAERIRRALADEPVLLRSGRTIGVTVSIGIATATSVTDVDPLFLEADHALYAAKHGGRNRVQLAQAQ